jgi:hypothetical protein
VKWDHLAIVAFLGAVIYALRPAGQLARAVPALGDATAAVAVAGL